MQKKIVALAVAAAFSAPAFADSNVVVYGKLSADVESVRASAVKTPGTDATSYNRVVSNASRFGIKGSEDLTDGLQGIYQIETRINLVGNETTAVNGTTPAVAGGAVTTNVGVFNGLRNTHVGLKGGFGTAFIGHWDTPFKAVHNKVELFDNTTIGTSLSLLGNPKGAGTGFNQRYNSSVQYWTPDFSGFQVKADYSTSSNVQTTAAQKPSLFSLSAAYDNNGIYVGYAYEQHKDLVTAGMGDKGQRLVAAYNFGDAWIGATYELLKVDTAVGTTKQRKTAELSGNVKFGSSSIGALYAKAGAFNGNAGATQASLRYGYSFSKRTELFALYTQINNKTGSSYNFVDVPAFTNAANASKVSGFGLGVQHSF